MSSEEQDTSFRWIPIPRIFQPFLEDDPFERCIVCQRFLLENRVTYMIEKVFKGTEVIVEYALCLECCQSMRSDMSEESLMRIQAYMEERVDLLERHEHMIASSPEGVDPWIAHCLLTDTPRQEADTYHIFGHCQGNRLLLSFYPFMVCNAAMKPLANLLSKKTRECLDDFTDQFLGMPPEFKKLFDDTPVCFI